MMSASAHGVNYVALRLFSTVARRPIRSGRIGLATRRRDPICLKIAGFEAAPGQRAKIDVFRHGLSDARTAVGIRDFIHVSSDLAAGAIARALAYLRKRAAPP